MQMHGYVLRATKVRGRRRRPVVPPELDDVCAAAADRLRRPAFAVKSTEAPATPTGLGPQGAASRAVTEAEEKMRMGDLEAHARAQQAECGTGLSKDASTFKSQCDVLPIPTPCQSWMGPSSTSAPQAPGQCPARCSQRRARKHPHTNAHTHIATICAPRRSFDSIQRTNLSPAQCMRSLDVSECTSRKRLRSQESGLVGHRSVFGSPGIGGLTAGGRARLVRPQGSRASRASKGRGAGVRGHSERVQTCGTSMVAPAPVPAPVLGSLSHSLIRGRSK
ncbi:hypothetical protein C8Q78DRAFT_389922 [Trametes maxima]|nr:hypothetical protein C8Q78DRAFT_389922 [Trametes maxima]